MKKNNNLSFVKLKKNFKNQGNPKLEGSLLGGVLLWCNKAQADACASQVWNLFLPTSCKLARAGGKVTLLIKETEYHLVKISVKDEGIGIPADKLGEIFNLASQSKSDGTAGEKGTGLGLIVCKEFVEKNNSKLIVKSKVGEGSEFSFVLQLV